LVVERVTLLPELLQAPLFTLPELESPLGLVERVALIELLRRVLAELLQLVVEPPRPVVLELAEEQLRLQEMVVLVQRLEGLEPILGTLPELGQQSLWEELEVLPKLRIDRIAGRLSDFPGHDC
jgi:hypothetical protein